jgi:hypothetical protein
MTPILGIMSQMRPAVVLTLALGLAGCSSTPDAKSPPKAKAAKPAAKTAPSAAPAVEEAPPGTVARRSVDNVLLRGPGWLLSRVQTEEVLRQNKFIGWRLLWFPADWDKTGLQPGDVVTELNGVALEKPEDLWNAWLLLSDAPELRIAFERDGRPAVTVVKIHGAPISETKVALETGTGGSAAAAPAEPATQKGGGTRAAPPRKRETIVITDESAGGDDDTSSMYY